MYMLNRQVNSQIGCGQVLNVVNPFLCQYQQITDLLVNITHQIIGS